MRLLLFVSVFGILLSIAVLIGVLIKVRKQADAPADRKRDK
jgi:hypothetical protein